jgi:cytochrome o ubiquinol oxidase operon protein cyoD
MTPPADGHGQGAHGDGADGHGGHDAHDTHGGHGEGGGAHATLKGYLTGFALSVVLTAIPFWLVMDKVLGSPGATIFAILALGSVQIVVHMIYFLHMDARSEGGWNLLALIFTLMLVVITLSGSLWVMFHLNRNMMPVSTQQMRNMP